MQTNWLDKQEYPFQAQYFSFGPERMHYIDEGQGNPLVFVHGTPSWSFDFRHVIRNFRSDFRCIAMDHIGFGLSDKPSGYTYSTRKHAQHLETFLLEKKLENITLVVHDFGGPIGFDFALRHPEKITRIIVLNSWLWNSENTPEYARIRKVLKSPLAAFLYKQLNFSARYILPRAFGDKKISKPIHRHYTRPFSRKSERQGTWAFAQSLLQDQSWFGELWEQRELLARVPVLCIWGMKDPILPAAYAERFASGFPCCQVVQLSSCGHFPQEEEPEQVIDAMDSWLQKTKSYFA